MRAITIEPRRPGALHLEEVEDVRMYSGLLAVRTLAIGACGTDRELIGGRVGRRAPGQAAAGARARIAGRLKTVLAFED
jgi:hypothetical protein